MVGEGEEGGRGGEGRGGGPMSHLAKLLPTDIYN